MIEFVLVIVTTLIALAAALSAFRAAPDNAPAAAGRLAALLGELADAKVSFANVRLRALLAHALPLSVLAGVATFGARPACDQPSLAASIPMVLCSVASFALGAGCVVASMRLAWASHCACIRCQDQPVRLVHKDPLALHASGLGALATVALPTIAAALVCFLPSLLPGQTGFPGPIILASFALGCAIAGHVPAYLATLFASGLGAAFSAWQDRNGAAAHASPLHVATACSVSWNGAVVCDQTSTIGLGLASTLAIAGGIFGTQPAWASGVLLGAMIVSFGLFGCAMGLLVIRADQKEDVDLALTRGLCVTVVICAAGMAASCRWVFDSAWLAPLACAAIGLAGIVLVALASSLTAPNNVTAGQPELPIDQGTKQHFHKAVTMSVAVLIGAASWITGHHSKLHDGAFGLALAACGMMAVVGYFRMAHGQLMSSSIARLGIGPGNDANSPPRPAPRRSWMVVTGAPGAATVEQVCRGVVFAVATACVVIQAGEHSTQTASMQLGALGSAVAVCAAGMLIAIWAGLAAWWSNRVGRVARNLFALLAGTPSPTGKEEARLESEASRHAQAMTDAWHWSSRHGLLPSLVCLGACLGPAVILEQLASVERIALGLAGLVGIGIPAIFVSFCCLTPGFGHPPSQYSVDDTPNAHHNGPRCAANGSATCAELLNFSAGPPLYAFTKLLLAVTMVLAPLTV